MNADAPVTRNSSTDRGPREATLPGGVELTLPASPGAPMLARRAAADALAAWTVERREIVVLVISELVTNAVRHGSTSPADEVKVIVRRRGRATRIEVRDHGTGYRTLHASRTDPAHARSGWGLPIVEELTDRWGVEAHEGRTVVWCEIDDV